MANFEISSRTSGHVLGIYEGATAAEALDAMARDAGYRDYADCCSVTGSDDDLSATEVACVMIGSKPVSFAAAVALMDDDIREALHRKLSPCGEQAFVDAYIAAHAEAFDGQAFTVA